MRRIVNAVIMIAATLCGIAQPKHEIRAVWLTTNGGLDWPKGVYSEQQQKADLCEILDRLADANFNTIVFQAQVKGDVAWESTIQPAMRDFTGNGSKSLSYDVSRFVIDECHKRNMECHAWIVPYRVGTQSEANRYNSNVVKHVTKTHPELCVEYNGAYYLDPGLPAVREYLLDLYRELINNYDFDGINFDYTRYPSSSGFGDDDSYKNYNPEGLPRDEWRRENINTFIAEFYEMAKGINPDIKVGAAPIGTYKNLPGYGNMTAYGVYQDACQWMQSGNHDLLIPQMYYNEKYGFSDNMVTWVNNCDNRQLVIGLAPYKMVDGTNDWETSVVTDQIEKVRKQEGTSGVCFFRADHVIDMTDTKIATLYEALQDDYFKFPAHIVPMDYNGVTCPNRPENVTHEYADGEYHITWDEPETDADGTPIKYYSVYLCNGTSVDVDDVQTVAAHIVTGTSFTYQSAEPGLQFAVTAFDKNYYESAPALSSTTGVDSPMTADDSFYYSGGTIHISASSEINHVEIYSLSGILVKYVPVHGTSADIDCNPFRPGAYILRTCKGDGSKSVYKFIH